MAARVGGHPGFWVAGRRDAGLGVGGAVRRQASAQVQHPNIRHQRGGKEEAAEQDSGHDQEAESTKRGGEAGEEAEGGDEAPGERDHAAGEVPPPDRDRGGEAGLRRAAGGEEPAAQGAVLQGEEEGEGGAEVPLHCFEQTQAGAGDWHHQARQRGGGESLLFFF